MLLHVAQCRVHLLHILHLTVVLFSGLTTAADNAVSCNSMMLKDRTRVKDSDFTESSYHGPDYNGKSARESFDYVKEELAWCPMGLVKTNFTEWIQVDMGSLRVVKIIWTKGRNDDGSGKEYSPYFYVRYKREASSEWRTYKKYDGTTRLDGNKDPFVPNFQNMEPPFVARWIRIYPYSDIGSRVCMKLQFYGCDFENHLLEYRIPQGSPLPSKRDHFQDTRYDGMRDSHWLIGGLGKLTDNDTALNEMINPMDLSAGKFVGWSKKKLGDDYVDMVFNFTNVRRFHAARFLVSNYYDQGIREFKRAEFRFSVGGLRYDQQESVIEDLPADSRVLSTRWVTIRLQARIGRFVQVKLFFRDEWIVLSEVAFVSDPVRGPVEVEPPLKPGENPDLPAIITDHTRDQTKGPPSGRPPSPVTPEVTYILVILCCLLGAMILCGFVALVCIRRRRHRKKKKQQQQAQTLSIPVQAVKTANGLIQIDLSRTHPCMSVNGKLVNEPSIYTSLPGSDTESNCPSDMQYACAMSMKPGSDRSTMSPEYASASMVGGPPPYMSTASMMPNGGAVPTQIISNPMVDYLDKQYQSMYETAARQAALRTIGGRPSVGMVTPGPRVHPTLPGPPVGAQFQAQICIQGGAGNNVYAGPQDLDLATPLDQLHIPEVSRNQLFFLEKLGGGQFGEVHLADYRPLHNGHSKRISDPALGRVINGTGSTTISGGSEAEDEDDLSAMDSDSSLLTHSPCGSPNGTGSGALVAVKMLRKDANEQAKRDFQFEIRILGRLRHPNIVGVLGVCSEEGSLCVLVEYMKFGDLHQFLQGHYSPDACNNIHPLPPNTRTLSYGALIWIASQIASGMKYLETLQMVHRDLACRNCLVGPNYRIKISDFGMCRRLYSTDYYRIEGRAVLPIRWMAWESVLQGRFTSRSDVWSFAVTLWEILTFCREQPFQHLPDEQVIVNCGLILVGDPRAERLPCPPSCPREIYDLMLECWNRVESQRPAFREIHMFLQRKNLGYNPRDEIATLNREREAAVASSSAHSSPPSQMKS